MGNKTQDASETSGRSKFRPSWDEGKLKRLELIQKKRSAATRQQIFLPKTIGHRRKAQKGQTILTDAPVRNSIAGKVTIEKS